MHDVLGNPLKLGDKVLIPAVITEISAHEDYCNVSLESLHGRRPDGQKEKFSSINTGVLVIGELELPTAHPYQEGLDQAKEAEQSQEGESADSVTEADTEALAQTSEASESANAEEPSAPAEPASASA